MNSLLKLLITVAVVGIVGCDSQETTTLHTSSSDADTSQVPYHNDLDLRQPNLDKSYISHEYGFSIRFPQAWQVLDYPGERTFVVNVFPPGDGIETRTPLRVHANAKHTYAAVLPQGLGTELPTGEKRSFARANHQLPLSFAIAKKESQIFYLQNGEP